MSTRSAAAASSSKRKRPSASAVPAESPAKRRTTRGAGASAAAATVADPPTLVPVAPPLGGQWCVSLRSGRDAGKFIDITLIVGGCNIAAHKNVLAGLSPYLDGLLTSGLAESKQGGDTLKIGDEDTDGRAVEAIVDCFYSGLLSLSSSTVSSVIRTANLLAVDAVEKAACDFFVESIEPSTACEALAFAAAHTACGEHARGLHAQCAEYVAEHFAECSVEASFLELSREAVEEVIRSDDLAVTEEQVLTAVRAWFDHDAAGRARSLKVLMPLVRWPLLPVEMRLQLSKEPLVVHMQRLDDEARALVVELLLELTTDFAESNAAAACSRLKRRKGPLLPLAFTALSQEHYATSEDGALLTATAYPGPYPGHRAALCRERVMTSGQSCAEVTVMRAYNTMIGVGRPTLDPNTKKNAWKTADFWGIYSPSGNLWHNNDGKHWEGAEGYDTGDVLRLLLNSDAGTLTIKKNGALLGVAVASGLTGDLCWAMCCNGEGDSVRIKAVDPAEF
eukprot:COSAG06_NODE_1554_length_9117_cov_3.864050_3_plen_507_part_00